MRRCSVVLAARSIRFAGALLLLILVWAGSSPAFAIPAFARKYQTSCQTCHIAFPTLTPFGEAFRLNGYRFPEGSDASISKDDPVAMGSEGYKKLWPRAVWPGEIPGLPPISALVESEIANDRAERLTSFDGFGGEFALLGGGTLGEHASFYAEVEFAREGGESVTELERLNLLFRPFSSTAFQFKIGAFEPGLLLVSNHRRLTDARYFLLSSRAGDNQWAAEPLQQGIELFGVLSHRLLYTAGFVEGSGNASNNRKDYYGRVAYKFGGLRLDGTTPKEGGNTASSPKPWSEKSLIVSAFTYQGSPLLSQTDITLINDPLTDIVTPVETTIMQEDKFGVVGGDIEWHYLDLIVRAGAASRTDRRPLLSDPAEVNVKVKNRFGELNWVAYPWLIPAARYESFEVGDEKTERISATVNFLVRANVKAFVAANMVSENNGPSTVEEYVGGVVVAF